jgi:hypothetical protein
VAVTPVGGIVDRIVPLGPAYLELIAVASQPRQGSLPGLKEHASV